MKVKSNRGGRCAASFVSTSSGEKSVRGRSKSASVADRRSMTSEAEIPVALKSRIMARSTYQLAIASQKRSTAPPLNSRYQPELCCAGLFAGIGGIELGLSRSGHETDLLCEIDAAAGAVLEQRFPRIKRAADVRELGSLPRKVEIIAAGFPCQDLSQAGRTAGITGSR